VTPASPIRTPDTQARRAGTELQVSQHTRTSPPGRGAGGRLGPGTALRAGADRLRDQQRALSEAERHAQIDSLTGVLNRRSVLERLDSACLYARARGLPISLLFIDLGNPTEAARVLEPYRMTEGQEDLRCFPWYYL